MKEILIASYDMEVGGVERSLVSMLDHFDYENNNVDLMLYKHTGDFMNLLPSKVTLLKEIAQYATFRKSIGQIWKDKQYAIALSRTLSRFAADLNGRRKGIDEPGYYQLQLMWKYALPFLPKLDKSYDMAISYLWPHYFVADKVQAKKKIAWIHTDYSTVHTDIKTDLKMWQKFDEIVAVSAACRQSFLEKYEELENKVSVMENITAPELVRKLGDEKIENPMTDDPRFKLITVARLSHAKGIDQAVRALKLLKNKGYKDISWYVAGYGGDEVMLRKLITGEGLDKEFILLGKQINPYPFMKAADLYVQPSRYEGKAVTVGEAQILGKPVLITNYPTAMSQVKDGFDGVICGLTVEGIADGVERLFHDPQLREKLAFNCGNTNFNNHKELEKLYKLA